MAVFNLIMAAAQSILQVVVIVVLGFTLARLDYFSNDKQKWLSKLNLVFFTPCLLFANIGSVISFEKLVAFWPIPAFYAIFTILNFTATHIVTRCVGLDAYYRRFVLACVMFSNSNSLPLAMVTSLAVSEAGHVLFWNTDDTAETTAARGISYTLFFAIFGNMIRWSYGYRLLRKQEPELFIIPDDNVSDPSTCFDTKTAKLSSCSDIESGSDGESTLSVKRGGMPGRQLSAVTITVDESTSLLHPNNNKKTVLSSSSSISRTPSLLTTRNPFNTFAKTIHSFMSPPLYAASLALIVGLSPLKPFLFDKSAFLYPSFTKAIETCGRAAVPLILTCLGAQLAHISQTRHAANNNEKKPVATAIFVRMILMPCLIIPMMILFIKYGAAYSSLATDPVFIVMMIILGCTPTALNLVQITQLNNVFEEEMVRLLFWSYGVVCIPICTFVVFISLNIVNTFL